MTDGAAFAEYQKKCSDALKEYEKKCDAAWVKYQKKTQSKRRRLIEVEY